MINYLDNPNVPFEKVVETISGEKEYLINCKKVGNKYYVKNKDCFLINNKWFTVDSGLIAFDHEQQKWVTTRNRLITGIVDFKDDEPVIGTFAPNVYNNVLARYIETYIERVPIIANVHSSLSTATATSYYAIFDPYTQTPAKEEKPQKQAIEYREVKRTKTVETMALNEDMLIANGFIEDLSTGYWVRIKDFKNISDFLTIKNVKDPKAQQYNIEENKAEYAEKVKLYNEYPTPISRNARLYSKFLGNITWGTELETICGYLPDHIQRRNGVVVCRDGSLKAPDGSQGSEYTTIPVSGAKGLVSLHFTCKEIAKRNKLNHLCALHIHIGNIPSTRVYILALYMLGLSIQDELFKMFAYYKNDEQKYANKEKNYCNKLMKLGIAPCKAKNREDFNEWVNWNYRKIFAFLSENKIPDKNYNRKNKRHPKNLKWERKNRYFWLNLMNLFFSDRNTAEFRLHTGTTNSQKVINWLFICNAIAQTAYTQSCQILRGKKFTLKEVLSYYPNTFKTDRAVFLKDYLMAYIELRKKWMKKDLDEHDYLSDWEWQSEASFEFTYESVKDLV